MRFLIGRRTYRRHCFTVPPKVTVQVKLANDAQAKIVDERLKRRIRALNRKNTRDLPTRLAASLTDAIRGKLR